MVARGVLLGLVSTLTGASIGCATETAAGSAPGSPGAQLSRSRGYAVHEATEAADTDAMQVKLDHGFLSQDAVESAIHQRFRELVRCYEQAGDARDFAGGPVRLRFQVDARGRTTDAFVLESGLGNFAAERCLSDVGRTIAFPRPQGGGTSFEYSLEFRASGAVPVIELPQTDVAPAVPTLLAQIATDCQRLGMDAMTATVYVGARGMVRSVGLAAPVALDPINARCVADSVARWHAPIDSVRGSGVGRFSLELRDTDVIAAATPPKPTRVAHQGRRSRRR
jgi:hypothetical protein